MKVLLLNLYLGFVVFLGGMIVFTIVSRKSITNKYLRVLFILLHFIASLFLSLAIWRFWPFDIDIMFGFISLPAMMAEIVTTLIAYLTIFGVTGKKRIKV